MPDDIRIVIDDTSVLKSNEFRTEKELQDFLLLNINCFIKNQFDDDVIEYFKEYDFTNRMEFGPRNNRIDLYVKCAKFDYLIELKNPTNKNENISAIGQLLNYCRMLSEYNQLSYSKKRMILITTLFDLQTAKTIEFFNLPIEYIYFTKDKQLSYVCCNIS